MKKFQLAIFLMFSAGIALAQAPHIERFVLAAGGDYYSNSNLNICFTVGELAAVETFTNPLMDLTQGFQQPDAHFVGVPQVIAAGKSVGVFPNPAKGAAGVRYEGLSDGKLNIRVINVLGQIVRDIDFYPQIGQIDYLIDLSGLGQGLYLVDLSSKRGGVAFREQVKLTIIN